VTLYRTARNLYQRLFNREYWQHRQAQKELYRPFVATDALAFDIGANRGEVSEAFLALGARVVAVEPNPTLAEQITRHSGGRIQVEAVAVGAEPGRAELSLGRDTGHSTLSQEWIERAPTGDRWEGTISTEVTTLDALIERHGVPDFVKIDVEAYEADVLAGLSIPLPAVCFEYQGAYLEVAERCVALLGNGYEYALTKGEEPFLTTDWVDAATVLESLRPIEREAYGDVFARRIADVGT
jgi:FkbM family methyltransferase